MKYTKLAHPIHYRTLLARIVANINPEYQYADYPLWFGYFDNGKESSLCVVCGTTLSGDCYLVLGNCPKVVPTHEVFPVGPHQAANTLMSLAPEVLDVRHVDNLEEVEATTIARLDMRYPHIRHARHQEAEAARAKADADSARFYLEGAKADLEVFKALFKADEHGVYVKVAGGTYSKLSRADAEAVRKNL